MLLGENKSYYLYWNEISIIQLSNTADLIVGDMNARYNFWILFSSEFCVEFKSQNDNLCRVQNDNSKEKIYKSR